MLPDDLGKLGDVDGDGDFDALDYAVMEEIEKEARQSQKGRGNSGCCLVLLAPLAGLAMVASAWYKL